MVRGETNSRVVEFWQGRENQVHNRVRVIGGRVERLQP
jgi:pyridoxamine 5'-phosphate oxidase